jgi:hypothetical protein
MESGATLIGFGVGSRYNHFASTAGQQMTGHFDAEKALRQR